MADMETRVMVMEPKPVNDNRAEASAGDFCVYWWRNMNPEPEIHSIVDTYDQAKDLYWTLRMGQLAGRCGINDVSIGKRVQ